MHTTRILAAADFAYARIGDGERLPAAFAELFPDWHERERVAVVSRTLEEGIAGTGATLLALATRFYDAQREKARERGGAFFDYPRHFALIGGPRADVVHAAGGDRPFAEPVLRRSWGQLDVWPPTNWLVESPSAAAMLGRVYALQIDRLFWPAGLAAAPTAPKLPSLARKLLHARLKQVVLYGADAPDAAVSASPSARDLVAGALAALGMDGGAEADRLRRVPIDEFLASMECCFADEAAAPA